MSTENQQNATGASKSVADGNGSSTEITPSDASGAPSSLGKPIDVAVNPATAVADHVVHVTAADESGVVESGAMPDEGPSISDKVKTLLIGKPRDLADKSVFTHISLVAFLAWVGLGADGLSSSCYGPPEAFGELKGHTYLGIFLALAIMATVWIIATCYSHIIEEFPSGGGGYLVASKLLGNRIGVISGCALVVDYVLTISVSVSAAGDAIFGLIAPPNAEAVPVFEHLPYLSHLGLTWSSLQLYLVSGVIIVLMVLNLRGVKESIQVLLPIFIIFLITHALVIIGAIVLHLPSIGEVASEQSHKFVEGMNNPKVGLLGMVFLLLRAYSMGAGTYTGLEAVSNSMTVLREPRVDTAKRTMRYMAISLSLVAGGLIIAYLLLGISHSILPTMNQLLTEKLMQDIGLGGTWISKVFVWATLLSAGALLVVGAQAGFIDGPRVLANMAHDSWVPRWFANLSERLAQHNGIILMGLMALAAVSYTKGNIQTLVIMYSINVFLTFSLSMIGMCRHWIELRKENPLWRRRLALFLVGAVLCVSILCVSVAEKFTSGGWVTVFVTGLCVGLSFFIHHYYNKVGARLRKLDEMLGRLTPSGEPTEEEPDPSQPTAVILVGNYNGLGIHTMLSAIRFAPDHFRSFIFISTGVIDSGSFKGSGAIESLNEHITRSLDQYVDLARRLGMPATSYMRIGTDAVDELEELCLEVVHDFPKATFFAGQLVFEKDNWVHRLLHNQTAYSLQRRLQWAGYPMVILPTRVR
jgi:amino acid transporter